MEERRCGVCGTMENNLRTPLMKCSCQAVFYCGKECQLRDFPDHKKVCTVHAKKGKDKAIAAGGADCWKVGLASAKYAKVLMQREMYKDSEEEYKNAIRIFVLHKGEENETHSRTLLQLGNLYSIQDRSVDALCTLGRCLEISRLVDEDESIAACLRDIGIALGKAGIHEKAMKNLTEAHDISVSVYGETHPEIAKILHNMGSVLDDQGKYAEAIEKYQESLRIKRGNGQTDTFPVAASILNLGAVKMKLEKWEESYATWEEGLVMSRKLNTEHHIEGRFLAGMGDIRLQEGRSDDALELYNGSLRIFRKHLGPKHPEVARILNSIAQAYHKKNFRPEVLQHLEECLAIRKVSLGDLHIETGQTIANIAQIKDQLGDRPGAIQALKDALVIYDRNGGGTGLVTSLKIRGMLMDFGEL
eukprot:CAMPEP_0173439984 /NCGR_PEP_ID=MMETSP1357-20121228/22026_1 /TAXON_ID=77926 /ORGANISM="Hemiselmis rufescens, Strain PCC563" /LENGTH=416 /DNA_ID=CAMNT_0014405415 /DNA_START=1 /DNA_END=1251 /DNA_ORIENTATION=+